MDKSPVTVFAGRVSLKGRLLQAGVYVRESFH
jgi:hypothetical protein